MKFRAIALVLASGLLSSMPVHAQSLAEASEAAKKIQHEWPASTNIKVYTNPDLPVALPGLVAAPGAVESPAATTTPALTVKDGEAYWRGRLEPLRATLSTDLAASITIHDRLLELQARMPSSIIGLQVFGPEVLRVQGELKKAMALVDEDRAAIAAVEEEGRRAGALPGWLR